MNKVFRVLRRFEYTFEEYEQSSALPISIVSLPKDVSDDLNFLVRRNLYLGSICLVTFIKI